MMSAEKLIGYGMVCIASVAIIDDRFVVTITDDIIANTERCIYAFLVGGEILRIGKSKEKLRVRLREWQRDVSNAFSGVSFKKTPQDEANIWREMLAQHGSGQLFAREGTLVTTPIGEINAYVAEEEHLIESHRPRLCRR
jgi:hypothetical protein